MATLIEHGDVIDLRDLAETLTERLDEWSDLSGEEQAVVRNTVDAVRSMLADLGVGLDDDDDTGHADRRVVDELSTYCGRNYSEFDLDGHAYLIRSV